MNDYISKTEKEIYEYSFNKLTETYTMNKIIFYQDIYNNPIIKDFLNKINNLDNFNNLNYQITNNNNTFCYDLDVNKTVNLNNSKIENLIHNLCEQFNLDYSNLTEMKYTLWDDKVELYEIKNKKTYNFLYVYFDLFKRKDKKENNNIIYLDNKLRKICMCYHFDELISEKEYNQLKDMIYNVIKVILD
jgi:hypothetical protein